MPSRSYRRCRGLSSSSRRTLGAALNSLARMCFSIQMRSDSGNRLCSISPMYEVEQAAPFAIAPYHRRTHVLVASPLGAIGRETTPAFAREVARPPAQDG